MTITAFAPVDDVPAFILELQRRERHLRLRSFKVYEANLSEPDRPKSPDERNVLMKKYMEMLDNELIDCSVCCATKRD